MNHPKIISVNSPNKVLIQSNIELTNAIGKILNIINKTKSTIININMGYS